MRCNDCGATFDIPDKLREHQGECFGRPAYEEYYVCPECRSEDIEDSIACKRCDKENDFSLCEDCVDELSTDEMVLKYSDSEKQSIELGAIFTYHFSTSEIEELLLKEMKNSGKWESLKDDFIRSDYQDYIDFLEEEVC